MQLPIISWQVSSSVSAQPGEAGFSEAKADLARSLAAQPDSAEVQIFMGKLCQQENSLSEALDHLTGESGG